LFSKPRAVDIREPPPLKKTGQREAPRNGIILILFVAAKVKEIFTLGREYPWPRPQVCPRCEGGVVWGHGFVLAYFDGFSEGLFLRRYRCPACGCVLRLRPEGYFSRFQASIDTIRSSLSQRIRYSRWPPSLCRSRQRHWLRALRRKAVAYLGNRWSHSLIAAFDALLSQGTIPVSRSI
jgi:hypothetical protein